MTAVERLLTEIREVAATVDAHATDADHDGQLAPAVMKALHDHGFLRILLPRELGGAGLSLSAAFPVFEAAGRIDGAFGWNLSIGSITLHAVATRLAAPEAAAVLDDPHALVAGGVNPGAVTARRVPGGYRFTGRVGFASGSADATWLLTAAVPEGSTPADPLVAGLFRPDAATILDTWHVSGMRATSSADFLLHDAFVPDELTFSFDLASRPGGDVDSIPMASTLGVALGFVALGVAGHALDRLASLASVRSAFGSPDVLAARPDVQIAAARARALIDAGRAYVASTWRDVETSVSVGRSVTVDDLVRLRLSYVTATQNAIAAADLAWASAGSSAIYEGEPLERCWRDVHVVGQHHFVSTRHLERLGRITLGGPPGPGPI